jgi:hypothetical protein
VVSSVLRVVSLFCIAVVVVSFAAFASDEAGHSSKQTVARIGSGDGTEVKPVEAAKINQASPPPRMERIREEQHGSLRENVDDVNDVLTSPFKSIEPGDIWSQRIAQGLLALLVFGVGVGFVGRYAALKGI